MSPALRLPVRAPRFAAPRLVSPPPRSALAAGVSRLRQPVPTLAGRAASLPQAASGSPLIASAPPVLAAPSDPGATSGATLDPSAIDPSALAAGAADAAGPLLDAAATAAQGAGAALVPQAPAQGDTLHSPEEVRAYGRWLLDRATTLRDELVAQAGDAKLASKAHAIIVDYAPWFATFSAYNATLQADHGGFWDGVDPTYVWRSPTSPLAGGWDTLTLRHQELQGFEDRASRAGLKVSTVPPPGPNGGPGHPASSYIVAAAAAGLGGWLAYSVAPLPYRPVAALGGAAAAGLAAWFLLG